MRSRRSTADMDVVFRDNTLSNNHTNKVSAASNILVFSTSNGDCHLRHLAQYVDDRRHRLGDRRLPRVFRIQAPAAR